MPDERRVVVSSPENSETPLEETAGWVVPNRHFFVRNHFEVPSVDVATWRLRITGACKRPLELGYDDLLGLPQHTVFATLECAGNGRSFLAKPSPGVQWGAGGISHAEWTGVPLRLLLQEADLERTVKEVLAEGADRGTEADHPAPMSFARSLPLEKALHRDTILALRMNGEPLEPIHGFPVRLLVPGWYGVASVKWLERLEGLEEPFQGYFQTTKYTVKRRTGRGDETEMIGAMGVESEIVRPRPGETLAPGAVRVRGLAWAGENAVAAVEVSVDGGSRWSQAELVGPRAPYSWTLWEYRWNARESGRHRLLSRAISESGDVQPLSHDSLLGGYVIRFSRPIEVSIDSTLPRRDRASLRLSLGEEMAAVAAERALLPLDVEIELTHGGGI